MPGCSITVTAAIALVAIAAAAFVFYPRKPAPVVARMDSPPPLVPAQRTPEPTPPKPPIQKPDPLTAARLADAKAPGQITGETLDLFLEAYKTSSAEVRDWLVTNVARLNSPLFMQAHQVLKSEDKSLLISAGKKIDATNKEVAAASWYLDAEQQRETIGDKDIGVLTAYHQAATRNHSKATDWLCANVTAKPVPNTPLKAYDPFSSDQKTIDISPKDWKAGQVIRERFLKLSNDLPPLVAKLVCCLGNGYT